MFPPSAPPRGEEGGTTNPKSEIRNPKCPSSFFRQGLVQVDQHVRDHRPGRGADRVRGLLQAALEDGLRRVRILSEVVALALQLRREQVRLVGPRPPRRA